MKTNHTPGPWHTSELRIDSASRIVAQVMPCAGPEGKQNAANAHLIAAAPELLAALEAVAALSGDWGITTGRPLAIAVEQARAAIAKAKGE